MSSNPQVVNQEFRDINATDGGTVIAGPLSIVYNVGGTILDRASLLRIPAQDVETALHLANGWYKAPERTKSLVDVLQVQGVALKTPSSFSIQRYEGLREKHNAMQGVFIIEGAATSTTLPKASTGVSDKIPISCLRAVTVCLVSLCSKTSAVAILQQLIPYGLLKYDMDDAKLNFEGPLLAGLIQWVDAVTLEEENNKLKDRLLDGVEESLAKLNLQPGADLREIMTMSGSRLTSGEDKFILGVLKWAITPEHERESVQYPTRSLRAWMAASVMSQLGFTIYASESTVGTQKEYNEMGTFKKWKTFLVISGNLDGTIDALSELVPSSDRNNTLPPRAMLLQDIPHFVFRHLGPIDHRPVREAYKSAFQKAVSSFTDMKVKLTRGLEIKLQVKCGTDAHVLLSTLRRRLRSKEDASHQAFLNESDDMLALEQFCKAWQGPDSDELEHPSMGMTRYKRQLEVFHLLQGKKAEQQKVYTMVAWILGVIYGICSCACRDQGGPLQGDSEISLSPENIRTGNFQVVFRWAKVLMEAILRGIPYRDWTSLLFEMFVSANATSHSSSFTAAARSDASVANPSTSTADSESYRSPDWVFGIQSHGFTAVSDVLVRVQMDPASMGVFHITRGQLLNLPYDAQGYLRGPTSLRHAETLRATALNKHLVNNLPMMKEIRASSWSSLDDATTAVPPSLPLRLDIEPFWEEDPQTIILKARNAGIPLASLYITQIIHRLASSTIPCSCEAPTKDHVMVLPEIETWHSLRVCDLSIYATEGIRPGKLANLKQEGTNYIIDASNEGPEAVAYILGIIDASRIKIARDCIPCAYRFGEDLEPESPLSDEDGGTVIIIVPKQNLVSDEDEYYSSDEEEEEDDSSAQDNPFVSELMSSLGGHWSQGSSYLSTHWPNEYHMGSYIGPEPNSN